MESEESTQIFSPPLLWAQNQSRVFLKIDLRDCSEPVITVENDSVEFTGKGVGAQGLQNYAFKLKLHAKINSEETNQKINANRVQINLSKSTPIWWPKLHSDAACKPHYLKIDYDRFETEDTLDNCAKTVERNALREEAGDIYKDHPNVYEKVKQDEFGYKREDFRKVYLTMYNLCMYVGFMYVVCVLSVRYLKAGAGSFEGTYAAVGPAMCFLHLLQLLEVMHPVFGYVPGGVLLPLLQVGGRLLIVIFMLECETRLHRMPVVFYLFMTWSAIEIIRYPYYMSKLLHRENGLLTWLRYTAWIVLYPIGFLCEGVVIFRNLIYLDQDRRWEVDLSWPIVLTLKFSHVLRFYLLFLFIPGAYTLMRHMYKQRVEKIGPKVAVIRKRKTK